MRITFRSAEFDVYLLKTVYGSGQREASSTAALNLIITDSKNADGGRAVYVVSCLRSGRVRKYIASSPYLRTPAIELPEKQAVAWLCCLRDVAISRIAEFATESQFNRRHCVRYRFAHRAVYRVGDDAALERVYADKLADTKVLDGFCRKQRRGSSSRHVAPRRDIERYGVYGP